MPKEGHANGARGAELAGGDVVLLAAFLYVVQFYHRYIAESGGGGRVEMCSTRIEILKF